MSTAHGSGKSVFGRLRNKSGDEAHAGTAPVDHRAVPTAVVASEDGVLLDPVTGVAHRSNLAGWVERAVHRSHNSSTRALVAFVDIGLLRNVNDTYGPDVGDELLRQVGARLQSIDLPGTRVVRWEGAEFALVFEKLAQSGAADKVGQFIVELLTPAFDLGHDSVSVECYVGGAVSDDSYGEQADLMRDAHQSVLEARQGGPGTVVMWDESKRNRYAVRITPERLQEAINDEEFLLHWQPVVRLVDDGVVGAESLLRWKAPNTTTAGVLFPNDFLPQLETSGLIVPVGKWVVRETCRQVAEWTAHNPNHRVIYGSCNLGGRQLAQTDFQQTVEEAIAEAGIEPWQLCLDLTESALRYNKSAIWASLRGLKAQGVKLGLDDFGSGESSVGYLREFAVDIIRIDRRFTAGVLTNREDAAIVRHLTAMAHDLDITVVAEGVEEADIAKALAEMGVDLAQGYLYGRPEYPSVIDLLLKPESERRPTGWDPAEVMDPHLLEHPHWEEPSADTAPADPIADRLGKRPG